MLSNTKDSHRYDDIIDLPHHQSTTRPHMPRANRAAQFAPFAALTGYEAAISETRRLTDSSAELDESQKSVLNEKLRLLLLHQQERPEATITFFVPDPKKAGGAYHSVTGIIQKIDCSANTLLLENKTIVPIGCISAIDSPLFLFTDMY